VNADGTLSNETAEETAKPKKNLKRTTKPKKKPKTTTTAVTTTAQPTSASSTTKRQPTTTSATTRRRTASPSRTKKDANNKAIRRLKKEVKKEMDNFEEYSERVARFMKTLEGEKWLKARELMSKRIRSRTRKFLMKTIMLSYRLGKRDRGSSPVRSRLKKEMDDFEKYSERVARFMKKL